MTKADLYLLQDIQNILDDGVKDINPRPKYADGTPAHTVFVTHNVRSYNLSRGEFPICTLRPIVWKKGIGEMLWIYRDGSNDLKLLEEKYGINWWWDWESKDMPGTIGKRYGFTQGSRDLFRKRIIDDIQKDPYGRYHICNLWQEDDLTSSDGLNPCAYETIWSVRGRYLDMILNQRSGDMLVASGAGHVNEVQYAALHMMVARHTGYIPGKFTHIVVNEQIYDRHLEQAEELMSRPGSEQNPRLVLREEATDFYKMSVDDFSIVDYEPNKPQLKFELGI